MAGMLASGVAISLCGPTTHADRLERMSVDELENPCFPVSWGIDCLPGRRTAQLSTSTDGTIRLVGSSHWIEVDAEGWTALPDSGPHHVVWLLNGAGQVVDHVRLGLRETSHLVLTGGTSFVRGRGLAEVRTAIVTLEPAGALTPDGPVLCRQELRRLQ